MSVSLPRLRLFGNFKLRLHSNSDRLHGPLTEQLFSPEYARYYASVLPLSDLQPRTRPPTYLHPAGRNTKIIYNLYSSKG